MKPQMMRCLLAALLVLVLAVSFVSCGKDPAGTTAPDTTTPDVTTPEDTEPRDTEPEETEPLETLPNETLPDETLPAETEPAETEPAETDPAETTAPEGDHRHQFALTQIYPTCTTSGTKMYVCACGEMYEIEGDEALGHAWSPTGSVESTCTVAGYDSFKCVSCGEQENRPLPLISHDFSISASLFSAEAVRTGYGFELLACKMCGEMLRVDAKHASGHSFAVQEDGSYLCACGAKAEATQTPIGSMDFTSNTQGENVYIANGVSVKDGKWVLSESKNQAFLYYSNNPELAQALTGFDADGNTVTDLTISFELEYTGAYEKDLNFIHLLNDDGWAGSIYFGSEDGKLALYDGDKGAKAVLEPDSVYLVKFILLPGTKGLRATVEGGTFAEPVTVLDKTIARELADSIQIGLSRPAFACGVGEDYTIWIDNMIIDSTELIFDPTSADEVSYCEHTFTQESLVDFEHPLEENWTRYLCSVCGCFYDWQSCDEHLFAAKAVSETPSTCVTEGAATYACLICGESVEETLPLADHAFALSTQVMTAEMVYGGIGYELLGCRDCKEMKLVMANHESGHCFAVQEDGSYLCACGAKASGTVTKVGEMDFSTDKEGSGIAFDSSLTVKDGKWVISSSWRQNFLYYTSNPALEQALNGLDESGEPIESFAIAFKLTYSGTYNKDLNFVNMLGDNGFLAKIHFGNVDGKLALYDGDVGAKTVLTDGETYTVKFIIVPSTNTLKATVEGGDLAETVTLYETVVSQKLSTSKQIGFSRPNSAFVCGEGENYVIEVDDLAFESISLVFDESSVDESNLCPHHLAFNGTTHYTCFTCERSFDRELCQTAGHLLTVAVSESEPSTCVTAGYEVHACYLCGEAETVELPLAEHDVPTTPTFVQLSTCVTEGYNEYKCDNCEYTETSPLPLSPHAYAVSTGVVTAANDPAGKGFELFACECGTKELKKVTANHAGGHFFENGACACGAKLENQNVTVATHDFTSWTGNGISFRGGSAACVDGKFRLSTVSTHSYIDKDGACGNVILYDLLDGSYGDASFDIVEFAFDLSYTGTMPASIDNVGGLQTVFSWRDPSGNHLVNIYLKQDEGALVVYGENGEAIIAADRDWRITISINLKNNTVDVVLSGNGIQPVSLTTNCKPAQSIANLGTIYLTRSQHYIDPKNGAIYMDNVALSYVGETVDLSAVNTDGYCEHDFVKTPILDDEHLEADKWYTYTCSACGGTYTAQEAKTVLLGVLDFESATFTSGDLKLTGGGANFLEGGKLNMALVSNRCFITATDNPVFAGLLDGVDADGNRVGQIKLSYDFSFDGNLAFSAADSGTNYVFFGLNENNGFTVAVQLRADKDGNAVVCGADKATNLTLAEGVTYTFDLYMSPNTDRFRCTVRSADMAETTLFDTINASAFDTFVQFVIGRNSTYQSSSFDLFIDNLSISYDKIS